MRTTWREKFNVGDRVEVRSFRADGSERWRPGVVTRVPERTGALLRGRFLVMVEGPTGEMEPARASDVRGA